MNSNLQLVETAASFFSKRCVLAVGYATFAQFMVFISYYAVVRAVSTVYEEDDLSTVGASFAIFVLCAVGFVQNILWVRRYKIKEEFIGDIYKTPLQKFLDLFKYYNLLLVLLYTFVGLFYSWLTLVFYNVNPTSLLFFMDHNTFLIFYGFTVSALTLSKTKHQRQYMIFPVVHRRASLVLREKIPNIIILSLRMSLRYLTNFIMGFIIMTVVFTLADFATFRYLDVKTYATIAFTLFTFGAFHILSVHLFITFSEVIISRPLEFTMSLTNMNMDTELNMFMVYKQNNHILQHLVASDLHRLSKYSKERRQLMFSLSHPGAHPLNWHQFIDEIYQTVIVFTRETNKLIDIYLNPLLKKEEEALKLSVNQINYSRLRNLSKYPKSVLPTNINTVKSPKTVKKLTFRDFIISKINLCLLKIAEKTGIIFLFCPDHAAEIKLHLNKAQHIVWLVETLANFVVISLKEDECGIIQNDLEFILRSLINLKLCAEKLNRLTFVNKSCYYFKMKISIQSAARRALFKIFYTFFPYVDELNIPAETIHYLCSTFK